MEYMIRTTDRNGNSWTSETRYSAVVRLLTELKQKRDITDLPVMRWACSHPDWSLDTMGYGDN
jgi:hypothetical protein